jgi:hypothetical protein
MFGHAELLEPADGVVLEGIGAVAPAGVVVGVVTVAALVAAFAITAPPPASAPTRPTVAIAL